MYLCIAENIQQNKVHQCDKGHHIIYVITNTGQKYVDKNLATKVGGKIGENFLLVKFPAIQNPATCMKGKVIGLLVVSTEIARPTRFRHLSKLQAQPNHQKNWLQIALNSS